MLLQLLWDNILATQWVLLESPFLFMLIALVAEFCLCLLYTALDLYSGRVPFHKMAAMAAQAALGFLPFIGMHMYGSAIIKMTLPTQAPTLFQFMVQLVGCTLIGDFFHYSTHRMLHSNPWLRNHIHKSHHDYEGSLFSWAVMEVHPVEVAMITTAIYSPFWLFAHPLVIWTFAFFASLNATAAHSGYEGGFASFHMPYALTASDHQLHHDRNSTKNFGNIFRIWDILFETYAINNKLPALSIWQVWTETVSNHKKE
jgi:sterol desaturase/sphingolipid hydroxylase (fatty acid hydroxylase superfamily)